MTSRRNLWYPSPAGSGRSHRGDLGIPDYCRWRAASTRGRPYAASRSVAVRSSARAVVAALLLLGTAGLSYAQPSPPTPLRNLVDDQVVAKIGYCRGEYTLTMANGAQHRYPEFNLRFKTDGSRSGPEAGKPALLPAGMQGDRAQVIFAGPGDLKRFLTEQC